MMDTTLQRALTAFRQQNWSQASADFTTLYQAHQTADLNRYLASSLRHDQQYLAAEQIASENEQAFLVSQEWFEERLTIALKNQLFIPARQWCTLPPEQTWRQAGVATVMAAEERSRQTLGATQRVIEKQFYHLGDSSLAEQRRRIRQAYQLPLDAFLRGVQYLLVDPFLAPLLRSTLLEDLYRLQVTMTVKLQWLDGQIYTVDTTTLRPMASSPAVKRALAYLDNQFAQSNPSLVDNVRQTLNLQLMLVYPFADKILTCPEAWIDYLVGQPWKNSVTPAQAQHLETWQNRLGKHLQGLFDAINNEKPEN